MSGGRPATIYPAFSPAVDLPLLSRTARERIESILRRKLSNAQWLRLCYAVQGYTRELMAIAEGVPRSAPFKKKAEKFAKHLAAAAAIWREMGETERMALLAAGHYDRGDDLSEALFALLVPEIEEFAAEVPHGLCNGGVDEHWAFRGYIARLRHELRRIGVRPQGKRLKGEGSSDATHLARVAFALIEAARQELPIAADLLPPERADDAMNRAVERALKR